MHCDCIFWVHRLIFYYIFCHTKGFNLNAMKSLHLVNQFCFFVIRNLSLSEFIKILSSPYIQQTESHFIIFLFPFYFSYFWSYILLYEYYDQLRVFFKKNSCLNFDNGVYNWMYILFRMNIGIFYINFSTHGHGIFKFIWVFLCLSIKFNEFL